MISDFSGHRNSMVSGGSARPAESAKRVHEVKREILYIDTLGRHRGRSADPPKTWENQRARIP